VSLSYTNDAGDQACGMGPLSILQENQATVDNMSYRIASPSYRELSHPQPPPSTPFRLGDFTASVRRARLCCAAMTRAGAVSVTKDLSSFLLPSLDFLHLLARFRSVEIREPAHVVRLCTLQNNAPHSTYGILRVRPCCSGF
jgi:hypothetical protein